MRASAAALLLLIAGCAQQAAPPATAAAPVTGAAPSGTSTTGTGSVAFDGTYSGELGTATSVASARTNCAVASHHIVVVVRDGTARTRWGTPVSGPVGADGSLNAIGPTGITLVGTFGGAGFSGTLTTSYCRYPIASLPKQS